MVGSVSVIVGVMFVKSPKVVKVASTVVGVAVGTTVLILKVKV